MPILSTSFSLSVMWQFYAFFSLFLVFHYFTVKISALACILKLLNLHIYVCISLCLSLCCLHVCAHVWGFVCLCEGIEDISQYLVVSSIILHLAFWDKASHWLWSLLFQLDLLASHPEACPCLHPKEFRHVLLCLLIFKSFLLNVLPKNPNANLVCDHQAL